MVFNIRLAGHVFKIQSNYRLIKGLCSKYLVYDDDLNIDDEIIIYEEDILEMYCQKNINYQNRFFNNTNLDMLFNAAYYESLVVHKRIAEIMPVFDTILMHGAVVGYEDFSYMFTAPSGVGKSTRLKLWLDEYPGSYVINGDKPMIKMTNKEVFACGTPWCGKEGWNTNTMAPLRAIFLLERADFQEYNSIEKITIDNAFPTLLQQTFFPSTAENIYKTLQLLKEVGKKVKIYRFRSKPTVDAIRLAYETANITP